MAPLTDSAALARLLQDLNVLLLAAGPFSETAHPWWTPACRGAFTTSISPGNAPSLKPCLAGATTRERRDAMVMPGCGFDVVASDCLASHVSGQNAGRVPPGDRDVGTGDDDAGFAADHGRARGPGRSDAAQRRFVSVPPGRWRRRFDYGRGDGWSTAVTWGDVATAFHTTGIPNIEVYFEETATFALMLSPDVRSARCSSCRSHRPS